MTERPHKTYDEEFRYGSAAWHAQQRKSRGPWPPPQTEAHLKRLRKASAHLLKGPVVKKLEKALKPAQGGTKKLRLPQPTIIHVNQLVIRQNAKHGTDEPPLTFRKGRSGKESKRAHEVTIHGPSKIVHSPHEPLPCGARVWIETFAKVTSR